MAALGASGLSKSSPALITTASLNLREFSLTRKRIADPDRPASHMKKLAPYEKIDLAGGNGRWRQRRAEQDFICRRLEEAELKRQQHQWELERERRRAERQETRRKEKEEEDRKRHEEEERQREDVRRNERRRWEQQEAQRRKRQEEEAERRRRMPRPCQGCSGTGICPQCKGKGYFFSTYLCAYVTPEDALQQYGKHTQGCEHCGGCAQGIRGGLQKGQGKCPQCGGYGKVWPVIDDEASVWQHPCPLHRSATRSKSSTG